MAKNVKPKREEEEYALMFHLEGVIKCPQCGALATPVVRMRDVVEWLQKRTVR